jgi:EAL domain-containing protein (putative c-di-GMP-specific phosphodiesterase class I)
MADTTHTIAVLDRLAALSVGISVDDFGTGYSSLQYLKRFPFDWLKIAKPFVDGVESSDAQARIARAIVDLAHSLEIDVIAEGIESKRQAAVLGEMGCLNGQGFHFSPPLPVEEISDYLAARSAPR